MGNTGNRCMSLSQRTFGKYDCFVMTERDLRKVSDGAESITIDRNIRSNSKWDERTFDRSQNFRTALCNPNGSHWIGLDKMPFDNVFKAMLKTTLCLLVLRNNKSRYV